MITILREEKIKRSRKDYVCDACKIMLDYGSIDQIVKDFNLSDSEISVLKKAKENNYLIKKGEIYYKQINTFDGFCVFRAIPEIDDICRKYGLYYDANDL